MVNGTGKEINITGLSVDGKDLEILPNQLILVGESFTINKDGFAGGNINSSYKSIVRLTYDIPSYAAFTGLTASGICLGKYQ